MAVATDPPRPAAPLAWTVAAAVLLTPPLALLAAGPLGLAMAPRGAIGVAVALVAAPLVEEAVLRPLLQRGVGESLRRGGLPGSAATLVAAVVATLAFALSHLPGWSWADLRAVAPWLAPGAALAATWCWRRRLADCVLLHAFFNASLWLAGGRPG